MAYYDEETDTTYYSNQMVLNITEFDRDGDKDSNFFIILDTEENIVYLYGSRGGSKHIRYSKSFDNITDLYNFISISMGFKEKHSLSISINCIDGLTNYAEYDDFRKKISQYNEIVAYDDVTLSKRELLQYLNAFF